MKLPTFEEIARFIYPEIFIQFNSIVKERNDIVENLKVSVEKNHELIKQINSLNKEHNIELGVLDKEIEKLEDLVPPDSILDNHLSGLYTELDNIAYKGKRFYKDKNVRVYLNQLITPYAYEIQLVLNRFTPLDDNKAWVKKLGNWVATNIVWTSDKDTSGMVDYLTYPEEVLVYKKDDCEGHAFLMASFEPSIIGVCYGFLTINGNKFGHAWNVISYDDKLFHVETTGNFCEIYPWDRKAYEPYFIVTQERTFQVKTGVSFGTLAEKIKKN